MQPDPATAPCAVHRLGLVEYQEAWEEQRRLVEACRRDGRARLLLLEHPPTYTFGVRGRQEHLLLAQEALAELGTAVYRVDRGGDITFHGPGQLVGYPILDLRRWNQGPLWYVRSLEATLIEVLSAFGIAARRVPGRPGVWVGEAKIAAIGVRVSRGVTSHGFALNVDPDLRYFSYIIPCGLPDSTATSMAEVLRHRTMNGAASNNEPRPGSTFAAPARGPDRPEGLSLQPTGMRLRSRGPDGSGPGPQDQQCKVGSALSMAAVMDAVVDAFARVFALDMQRAPVEAEGRSDHLVALGGRLPASIEDVMESPLIPLRERTRTAIREAKPSWLKVRFPAGERYQRIKSLLVQQQLHTVCEQAYCPNIGECFNAGTATFMILGDVCTRACGFCAVTSGRPQEGLDRLEPHRLARAVRLLGLDYAVITSVNRDDQPDGGASIFAGCIRTIRRDSPRCRVEVLIPDFMGNWDALATVVQARPYVLNHNVETAPRLHRLVRPKARYRRSLELLRRAKELNPSLLTKSGMMVGLGETREEVFQVMADLRSVGVDLVTIGQYLRPGQRHLPVERYYPPEEFASFVEKGRELGFLHVEASPLARSSYHAHKQVGLETAVGGGS